MIKETWHILHNFNDKQEMGYQAWEQGEIIDSKKVRWLPVREAAMNRYNTGDF
jgi:hypothetical protein